MIKTKKKEWREIYERFLSQNCSQPVRLVNSHLFTGFRYSIWDQLFFSFLYNLEQASDSNNLENELVGLQENVTAYFYGLLAGAIIVLLIYLYLDRKSIKQHFQSNHPMTVQKLILLIILLAGLQLPMVLIELASKKVGSSPFITLGVEPSTFYSMPLFLYTSFISPLLAELIFRGSIFNRLVKHGTAFAMLYSSVLYAMLYVHPI